MEQLKWIRELHFEPETAVVEEALEAAVSLWRILMTIGKEELERLTPQLEEMRSFVKNNAFPGGGSSRPLSMRITLRSITAKGCFSYLVPYLISIVSAWKKQAGWILRSAVAEDRALLFE